MPTLIIIVLALTLITGALGLAGVLPTLVPQGMFAVALVLALLKVVNESDKRRL